MFGVFFFLFSGDAMSGSEKDAGFCSGGDEDDMSNMHSPSASEDSVEVQVTPISLRNKRKLAEPRKIHDQVTPLKKRRFSHLHQAQNDEESHPSTSPSPFRPWSSPKTQEPISRLSSNVTPELARSPRAERCCQDPKEERWLQDEARRRKEEAQRRHEQRIQAEVLARLQESESRRSSGTSSASSQSSSSRQGPESVPTIIADVRLQEEPLALVARGETPRVPSHPAVNDTWDRPSGYTSLDHHDNHHQTTDNDHLSHHGSTGQQRNYKNMTRERRIEANARERTRVHTISAAFDTLRRSIPAYSHNQKLSKLSVLRIACSYIMTLSKIATTPEGEETTGPKLGACVDMVSRTIQTEGKLRKKKDE